LILVEDRNSSNLFDLDTLPKQYRYELIKWVAINSAASYIYEKFLMIGLQRYWQRKKERDREERKQRVIDTNYTGSQ